MEIIIVTGLSGGGKSQAMECLEDQGYYCIDNMPFDLVHNFLALASGKELTKIAFSIDIRGQDMFHHLEDQIALVENESNDCKILFFEASNETLLRRYNETRRVHPLTKKAVTVKDIEIEREKLATFRKRANFVIDTSNMKPAKMKQELLEILSTPEAQETFVINLMSFGFKYGVPLNADIILDMRFLPNPYYVPSLKNLTGNNKKIQDYVLKHFEAQNFIKNANRMLNRMIPCYMREGKWHLNIAFGCTGGRHRSVVMANAFEEKFKKQGRQVTLEHREIKR